VGAISTNIKLFAILAFIAAIFVFVVLWSFHFQNQMLERNLAQERRTSTDLIDKVVYLGGTALQTIANDYSLWDDMVQFVSTRDPEWPKVNIDPELEIFNVDVIWICDTTALPIYRVDIRGDSLASAYPLSAEDRDSVICNNRFHHSFARTKWGLLEIQQAPIQPTSDTLRQSPAKGHFMVGKLWSSAHLEDFSQLTGSQLSIEYSKERMDSLASQDTHDATINICKPLRDMRGRTAAYLVAKRELADWQNLRRLLLTQVGLMLGSLAVALIVLASSLYFWVSRPLTAVSRGLERENPELLGSLLRQNSEFGRLARLIRESVDQRRSFVEEIIERQQAEAALRESEEHLSAITNSAKDGIIMLDANRNVCFWNPAAERLTGYSAGEIMGRPFHNVVIPIRDPADSHATFPDKRKTGLDDSLGSTLELKAVRKDGVEVPVEISMSSSILSNRQYAVVIIRDITERKRVEEALRESEERLRDVIFSIANWVWEVDQNGAYTYSSQKGLDLLGRSGEEVIGKTPFDFMPPDEARRIAPIFSEIVANRAPIRDLENWSIRKDGERVCLLTNGVPILDKEGNLKGYRGVDQDITERKRVEARIQESESLYRTLIETTGTGYVIIDDKGRLLDANPEYVRLTGRLELDEIRGKNVVDWTADHEKEKNARAVEECSKKGFIRNLEIDYVDPKGKITPVEVNATVIEKSGTPIILSICRDITERKRAEEALRESRTTLNLVLDTVPQSIFWKDIEGRYLGCNQVFATAVGLDDPDRIVGKTDFDLPWPREEAEAYRADDRKVLESNQPKLHIIEQLQQADGIRLWIDTSKVPLCDANGRPFAVLGVYEDITERKQAEDALRDSETEHRMLFENAGVGITYFDLEGHVLMLNALAAAQLGGNPEDFVGRTIDEILPAEVAATFRATIHKLTPVNVSSDSEEMIATPDGPRWYFAKYTGIFEPNGMPVGVQVVTTDITDRKRAEDALRESVELNRRVIASSRDCLQVLDLEGNLLSMSEGGQELLEIDDIAPYLNEPWEDFWKGKDKEAALEAISKTMRGDAGSFSAYCETAKGTPKWWEVVITPIRNSDGKIENLLVVSHDITERKHTQEERTKFMSVIESTPEAIVVLNADGNILYINHAFEAISGMGSSQAVDQYYDALARKLYAYGDHGIPWDKIKAGESWTESIPYKGRDGGFRLMDQSISPIRSESGEIINYVVFSRDVTEERELEISARWADERLRLSIDGMVDGLTLWDVRMASDGSIQEFVCSEANPAALMMLGKERGDAVGRSVRELLKGVEDRDPYELFLRVHDRGESLTVDNLHLLKGNQRLILTIHVWPIGTGVACHLRDVTQQLELETQLRQAQKLEAVGSLAAGIAHEINTPIQFVGDNIRFLADSFSGLMSVLEHHRKCREKMASLLGEREELQQLRDLDKQVDVDYLKTEIPLAVEQSLEGVSRVSTIVRAMKDFSHIDEREMVLADINQMLDTTLTVARNELKYVADVVKDLAPDLPAIECFRNDLNQVFLNLLINAAHAIQDVVGDDAGKRRGTITVKTRRDGDSVVISISDTGSGIPDSIRDRIFEHFFTTKEVGKGTGQGLSIARSIVVEKHKGAITFDSEIGKGTTFYIRLPITRKEVEHAESQHPVRG